MYCKICNTESSVQFSHIIRGKYQAEYYLCPKCDFLFLGNPSWLKEAYSEPTNITDTGYITRNIYLSRKALILFYLIFGIKKLGKHKFLDYAGGYGIFTRIMRDYGMDYYWDDMYTPNLFSRGFEMSSQEKFSAITCFECFEHFSEPLKELEKILEKSRMIFFSTRLKKKNETPREDWDYYGFDHGQHLSFYSEKTFEYIADKYDLRYVTDHDNLHLLTYKKLSKNTLRLVNFLSKIQADLLLRKLTKSRIISDYKYLSHVQ